MYDVQLSHIDKIYGKVLKCAKVHSFNQKPYIFQAISGYSTLRSRVTVTKYNLTIAK